MEDVIVNIDLFNSQFSVNSMLEEAQKLGMEVEELEEYGFNSKAV